MNRITPTDQKNKQKMEDPNWKSVTWCFTPSQPLRSYQGDSKLEGKTNLNAIILRHRPPKAKQTHHPQRTHGSSGTEDKTAASIFKDPARQTEPERGRCDGQLCVPYVPHLFRQTRGKSEQNGNNGDVTDSSACRTYPTHSVKHGVSQNKTATKLLWNFFVSCRWF